MGFIILHQSRLVHKWRLTQPSITGVTEETIRQARTQDFQRRGAYLRKSGPNPKGGGSSLGKGGLFFTIPYGAFGPKGGGPLWVRGCMGHRCCLPYMDWKVNCTYYQITRIWMGVRAVYTEIIARRLWTRTKLNTKHRTDRCGLIHYIYQPCT